MIQFHIGGCHKLQGDRKDQYAVDLVHPQRFVFEKHGSEIQIANILEIQLFPGCSKTALPKKELLLEKLPMAIENAKKLCKWNNERGKKEHTVEYTPGTEMFTVFEENNLT